MTTIDFANPGNYALAEIAIADLTAIDLAKEASAAVMTEPVAAYRVTILNSDGYVASTAGQMIWLPNSNRAGIAWGSDAQWTDANSPEDAIRRYATDEMAE